MFRLDWGFKTYLHYSTTLCSHESLPMYDVMNPSFDSNCLGSTESWIKFLNYFSSIYYIHMFYLNKMCHLFKIFKVWGKQVVNMGNFAYVCIIATHD